MSLVTKARQRRLGIRQAWSSNSANLWMLQSPTAESPVTLSGDLRMKLFYYCEGDPTILSTEYRERALEIPSGVDTVVADAMATLVDGSVKAFAIDDGSRRSKENVDALSIVCRESLVVIGTRDLGRFAMRMRNWQFAISAYHRSRGSDLGQVAQEVEAVVRRRGKTSLGEVMRSQGPIHPAVVIGAIVLALRNRVICSDMDTNPWSSHTKLLRARHDFGR